MTALLRLQDFCLVADQLREQIVVQTIAGHYVYMNPPAQRVLGYTLQEVNNFSTLQLVHPDDRHVLLDAYLKLSQEGGQARPITYRIKAKNGQYIISTTTPTVLMDERGKAAWIVSISHKSDGKYDSFEQARELAAVEERQRLARDLHDAVSQTLFSASVIAESLPMLYDVSPNEVMKGLRQLNALTKGALAEMRTLLVELRPAALREIDLSQLLVYLVNSFRTRLEGEIIYENIGCVRRIDPETKVSFYRIAQEALNNVVRHSRATHVAVQLICTSDSITLYIHDNGCGFDARGVSASHMGLRIMYERAESSGIALDIISAPAEGTQVCMIKSWEIAVDE